MLKLDEPAAVGQVSDPIRIRPVVTQQVLHVVTGAGSRRFEMCDRLAPTHDREVLAAVLDRVEEVGEVPRGVGCTDLCH